ncbi:MULTISPECIES: ATP-binding response regulator [Acetobacteraceae]|uniref:histidine kinase n=1 Tax=Parasaccharibacter apium TaxID=1510841 RepID=A0A7U7G4B3_9PROT|nr:MULTISPECIES: ATP-binding protein [Acetobacteraceae]MCL1562568.1 hybrid sensor histidine kinase/response regulator [Parasaccharibacter sp. TMW 2.1886]MCQ0040671.1 ATP-binding protein [Bombella sp.]MUG79737.1 response regulator [Bombella sp. ESL0380]MCL1514316.1 hybrid sensor histidine kinase/response regulator [Parasaccharibacter sp. TMW 2.1891]MCT6813020.1 ATP-binding protein [Bombella apis]
MNEPYSIEAQPCVLLVDDEEEILVALGDLLEESCTVLTAAEPGRALALLAAHPEISVIISDQRMPGMTGDQFLSRASACSDARAILLTGYADLDAVVAALNHGRIVAYVHKPWEADHVLSLVHEAHRTWQAQRALKVEQALLHGLMESLPFGLVFSDAQGRCIRSNRHHQGTCESDHYTAILQPVIARLREKVWEDGQAEELLEVVAEDGQRRWHEIVRLALKWPEDVPLKEAWQVSMDRDVTQRVMVEDRLNRGERLEALGRLAGGVAHDFNNLLTILGNCLEALSGQLQGDEAARATQKKWLARALETVERGEGLTRRLLQFGRAGRNGGTVRPFDIAAFLEERASLFRHGFYGAVPAIRFVLDLPEGTVPPVLTCPEQLEMALLNLCVNARDAMPDGGTVTLSASRIRHVLPAAPSSCEQDHALALDVRDEGEGMSEEVQRHIFEPFFTTKQAGKGTGLGLAGIYSFVLAHHGDVVVQSRPGEGTVMRLLLPLLKQ